MNLLQPMDAPNHPIDRAVNQTIRRVSNRLSRSPHSAVQRAGQVLTQENNPAKRIRHVAAATLYLTQGGIHSELGLNARALAESHRRIRQYAETAQWLGDHPPISSRGFLTPPVVSYEPGASRKPQAPVILTEGDRPLLPNLPLASRVQAPSPVSNLPLTPARAETGEIQINLPLMPGYPPSLLPFRLAGSAERRLWISDQPEPALP